MSANVIQMPGNTSWDSIAPRAPIAYGKSGTIDRPDDYYSRALTWRSAAREEALQTIKLNPEKDFLRAYTEMLEGRYNSARRAKYRSSFFDNRLAEARLCQLTAMTDIRPAMEVRSSSGIEEYTKQSDILGKLIKAMWDNEDLDLATEAVVDHAMLTVGYWKIGATLATQSIPARMLVMPCGMDMVLPIQPSHGIQNSTAVLYRVFKPLHRVKQAYGMSAEGIEREITGSFLQFVGGAFPDSLIPEYTASPMNPATRMQPAGRAGISMASESGPFAAVEVEEYWIDDPSVNESGNEVQIKDPRLSLAAHNYHYRVPPGERLFPRKRLMVWAGTHILYDGPSPYWHGLYPFAELILRPAVWRMGGISAYRNLVPLQLAMNEVGAGTLDLCKRAVDPQMAYKDGCMDDTSFRNFSPDRHGAQLKMNPHAEWGRDARYIDAPTLPAYVGAFVDRVSQAFDRQSGSMDMASMMHNKQTPGGDTVSAYQDAASTIFRLDTRHIEPFMRAAGTQFVSNFFQFWSRAQRMWSLGDDGITWNDFDYDPDSMMVPWYVPKEDHYKSFPVHIAAGSMHGGKTDRDKQVAMALYKMNAIDRETLLEILQFPKVQQVLQRLAQQQQEAPVEPPKGTGKGASPRMTRGQRVGNPY
jgi:hypothetical protein